MNMLNDPVLYDKAIRSTLLDMLKRLNDLTMDNFKLLFLEVLTEKCNVLNNQIK